MFEKYHNHIVKRVDGIIIPSTIEGLNPYTVLNRNVAVVGNMPKLDEMYKRYEKKKKEHFFACYIGQLSEQRGITSIVKACIRTETNLVLAGTFYPENYQEELRKIPMYDKYISYHNQCTREEVFKILSEASCGLCVLNSVGQYGKVDTMATKVYEYLSMGLPVIIHSKPYSDKMIIKYRFGITVESKNDMEISEAIQFLKNDKQSAENMGEKGREAILLLFNWEFEEKKLFALYKDVLASEG